MNNSLSVVRSARSMWIAGALCLFGGAARAQTPCPPMPFLPFLPDLTVAVDPVGTACDRVTFTVTLAPPVPLKKGPASLAVRVRVLSPGASSFPIVPVGEVLLFLPRAGGSASAAISWAVPPGAVFDPDFSTRILVVVDPDKEIDERNECNNFVQVIGTCLG